MTIRDYDYSKDVLDSLLNNGIIDKELYEKCNDNDYNITIDDVEGIKMNINGTIKQVKKTGNSFVDFSKTLDKEFIKEHSIIIDYPPQYLEWLEKAKKEGNIWITSLGKTQNWKFSRDEEKKFIDSIDEIFSNVKYQRKEINSIPVMKSVKWDKKNKQKYIGFLNTMEDQLNELKRIIRKKVVN